MRACSYNTQVTQRNGQTYGAICRLFSPFFNGNFIWVSDLFNRSSPESRDAAGIASRSLQTLGFKRIFLWVIQKDRVTGCCWLHWEVAALLHVAREHYRTGAIIRVYVRAGRAAGGAFCFKG